MCLVEVLDGRVHKGDKITAASTGKGQQDGWSTALHRTARVQGSQPCRCPELLAAQWAGPPLQSSLSPTHIQHSFILPAGTNYEVIECGLLAPDPFPTGQLLTGQVGYMLGACRVASVCVRVCAFRLSPGWHGWHRSECLLGCCSLTALTRALPASSPGHTLRQSA